MAKPNHKALPLFAALLFFSGSCSQRKTTPVLPENQDTIALLVSTDTVATAVFADTTAPPQVYHIVDVEEQPEFPDGQAAMVKFLQDNINLQVARDSGLAGIVYVEFVVREDGRIDPNLVRILRGVHPILNNEALRVVRAMPQWKPGRQMGKAVPVAYTLPFRFGVK